MKIQKTTPTQSKINLVYINSQIPHNDTDFVLIDATFLYAFEPTDDINLQNIALSKIQREFLNKTLLNDTVEIDFIDKKYIDEIKIIKFNVEIINLCNVELDSNVLKEAIKDIYLGFPFNITQKLYIAISKFPDIIFVLSVVEMICDVKQPYGVLTDTTEINVSSSSARINITNNHSENMLLDPSFSFEHLGIGGLKKEFEQMFRRAFVQRLFDPSIIKKMGIPHVKGIMLYGPPGTGKTLIARKLGSLLNARPPKIVNGPEILNKYVGQSEENIRNLFKDAEDEWRSKKEDSQLHIIIFDEIDAICKKRGSGGSTGANDQVVNQLLSKIDGVDSLDNILVIGMTNRLDLIDDALLRPGRFEIHLEISLPDESARFEIFQIHTKQMSGNDYLDKKIDVPLLAKMSKNYTGAELAAVVRGASSFALERKVRSEEGDKLVADENILITMDDMLRALDEIKPAFGYNEKEFETFSKVFYETESIVSMISIGKMYLETLRNTNLYNTNSLLFYGENGCGKTTLAVRIALQSTFPFIKIISPRHMVGLSEWEKVNYIKEKFMDAYKSEEAIIILDDIEGLIEFVGIGPRFSNSILQAIKIFVKADDRNKLFVLGTTSIPHVLKECGIYECFSNAHQIKNISEKDYERLCEQNNEFRNIKYEEAVPLKKIMACLSHPDLSMK
ncbi:transport between ER and Golgi ATPase protein [Glugoides intestinalis]